MKPTTDNAHPRLSSRDRMVVYLAILSALLLYVWQRVDLVRVGYEIQQLKVRHVALQREHHELRVKVSALSSPERIARLATEKLGMRRPKPGEVVLVNLDPARPHGPGLPAPEVRLARHEVRGAAR